jgi:NitT/TauT family transport system ATP-binding protein
MLDLNAVSLTYRNGGTEVTALDSISLTIVQGRTYAIIGPSGCGKTSLLFLMAGLISPSSGEVTLKGRGLTGPQQETALILQEYGLLPWKTVRDNATLGLKLRKVDPQEATRIVDGIFAELHLQECLDRYPSQLSGGQKQRVALARALALQPELLLMDEPLSALDALTREKLQQNILQIWLSRQMTLVLVTHSIEEAVFLGQEVIILSPRPGKIRAVVDNPLMGCDGYRNQAAFHEKCTEIRTILEENSCGEQS